MWKWLWCTLAVLAVSPAVMAQQPPHKPRVAVTTEPGSEGQLAFLLENLVALGFDVSLGDTTSPSAAPVRAQVKLRDGGSVVEVLTADVQPGKPGRDDVIRATGTSEQERRDAVVRAVESLRARLIPVGHTEVPATPAVASPPAPQQHDTTRSGLSLCLLVGGGYGSASYAFEGMSLPGYDQPVRLLRKEATLSGATVQAAVQPGWWLSPKIKVGAELAAVLQTGGSDQQLGATRINHALAWQALALVDARLSDEPGFRVQAGGGYTRTAFISSREDIGGFDNIVDPHPVSGAIGVAGMGYDFTRSVGADARASYSRQSNDPSTLRVFSVGVLWRVTLW